ncbi:MAG TPA: hypothetical protein VFS43_22720 [Polyangiaceae bacterium]|nr:hypothetical protein [Polyangiaceae bacterium]
MSAAPAGAPRRPTPSFDGDEPTWETDDLAVVGAESAPFSALVAVDGVCSGGPRRRARP